MKKFKIYLLSYCLLFVFAGCSSREEGETSSDTDSVTASLEPGIILREELPAYCNNARRFSKTDTLGGGVGLSQDDAMSIITSYRDSQHKDTVTGFFISKEALDTLFANNDTANGIWLDLVNPRDVPEAGITITRSVIVSVRKHSHSRTRTLTGQAAFIAENGCPEMCDRF